MEGRRPSRRRCQARAPGAAAEPIEAGQELKRAIGPGETHSYEVPLSSDQYVRFALDCEGTRLTTNLLRPNGDVAIVLSDTRQHESPVSLSLIALNALWTAPEGSPVASASCDSER